MELDSAALATIGGTLALIGGLIGSSIGIGIAGSAGAASGEPGGPQEVGGLALRACAPNE